MATTLGLTVSWPNEPAEEPETGPGGGLPIFLAVEIEGDGAEPYEIGGGTWQEDGTVYVHILSPTGAGIEPGNAVRKAVAVAFRGLGGGAAPGLFYDRFRFPPGGSDEASGNWYRLSLGISYRFTDA